MCGSAPSAPQLPQYPNQTPQEQGVLNQWQGANDQYGGMIKALSGQLGNNQSMLQQLSGLFNQDGSINQTAMTALSQRSQQGAEAAGNAGTQALQGLGGIYGQGGALGATESAYTNALSGGAPANQQMQFEQNKNFQAMKQQAAQQGIQISGDNWGNATSSSTAGAKLIQNYQQNSNMQNQNYNLGYIGQLAGNMGQISNAGAQTANTGMGLSTYGAQTPMGYAQQSITNGQSAIAPYLQNYGQMQSQLYQPYYMQQIGPYQQQMAQSQANYQAQMNQFNNWENQIGMLTPSVSFMGFGVNPHAGNTGSGAQQ